MTSARRHRAFGPATGWWATTARALALVLAFALAAPASGLADDLAFHAGHRTHERAELSATVGPDAAASQVDPGLACHVHCSCHVAAALDAGEVTPPARASRRAYDGACDAIASVSPERLARPPRA